MAELQTALKTLAPIDFEDLAANSSDELSDFLSTTFLDAQILVDSIPIPPPTDDAAPVNGRSRSATTTSIVSIPAEISPSNARGSPRTQNAEELQKEWGRPVKLNAKDNPLGISVYKLAGRDGKGAWFARRSVHKGMGFSKWKKGLEMEFPETMKVQGAPGDGNIRGIGGERRVEFREVDGVGKLEVYHLSAQFPGPTTPRDFVTLLLTSDSMISDRSGGDQDISKEPRQFMVVSKPCIHLETPERDGFIRGQYQSVEFIREVIEREKPEDDIEEKSTDREQNPVEWIMLTRSDPGGSVPRFMVERGTPGSIVADATKFLKWANSVDMENSENERPTQDTPSGDDASHQESSFQRSSLHDYQTNGHLAGLDGIQERDEPTRQSHETSDNGFYGKLSGALGAASAAVAAAAPSALSNPLRSRRDSTSSSDSMSSSGSFASALEGSSEDAILQKGDERSIAEASSTKSSLRTVDVTVQDKDLMRLEERKRRIDDKLAKTRERELQKTQQESEKEAQSLARAAEKHERDVAKHQEKYRKEVAKLEARKAKELSKNEEKKRRATERDEKARLTRELEEVKADRDIKKKENELLRIQIGELQAENTALAARVGKLEGGDDILKHVRSEVNDTGRLRSNSIRLMLSSRNSTSRGSLETTKDVAKTDS